jgi:hypothetical protein
MIRRYCRLALAFFTAISLSSPHTALALPVAKITYGPASPVTVGQAVAFDGSASVCDFPPCRYIWTWYYASGVTGGQIGEGQLIDYAFPASASGKTVAVVEKVVANTKTHGFGTATVRITVQAIPDSP